MDDDMVYHWGHEHPLTWDIFADPFRVDCKVCLRRLREDDEFYGCEICWSYRIHKSCFHEMPRRIHHSFHRDHNLTPSLSKKFQSFQCLSCKEKFLEVVSFQCSECDFFLCIECALKPDICDRNEGQNGNLICHEQPMRVEEKKHEDGIECYACHLPCSGPTFTCKTCNYFFHNSCLELPPQIQYPSHPQHPLKLHFARPAQTNLSCKSCHKSHAFIVFQCNECDFNICPECRFLKPTIKYQHHNHPLCLVDPKDISLNHCDNPYCKQMVVLDEFKKYTKSFMLRCVNCDFNLHLLCGRLPCTIKDECHVHSLTLVDSHIENSTDEYYCDICEEKRDPRSCIYYCTECEYVAHIHCVIWKVTQVLEGEFGNNVELRAVGERSSNMPINEGATPDDGIGNVETLKDLINKISKQDVEEKLMSSFYWNGNDSFEDHQSGDISNKNDEFSAYTDEDHGMLIQRLASNGTKKRLKLESNELAMEIVNVDGFEIPRTLAPVLKHILAKYRNRIVPKPKDNPSPLESFAYFVICRVTNSIFTTTIVDITEDLLQQWYCHAYFLEIIMQIKCGFLVSLVQKLEKIYSGREAKRRENDLLRKLPEKIAMHEAESKRCKELLRKLTAKERLENSDKMEEYKREASNVNKWKTARDLFSDFIN